MTDTILDKVADETGTEDSRLENRLQTYNGQAVWELAGDFLKRVGGMPGVLTATKEDSYGRVTEV